MQAAAQTFAHDHCDECLHALYTLSTRSMRSQGLIDLYFVKLEGNAWLEEGRGGGGGDG